MGQSSQDQQGMGHITPPPTRPEVGVVHRDQKQQGQALEQRVHTHEKCELDMP